MTSPPNLVFADRVRTDASPAGHSEPTARFLGRVAGDYWDQVRDLIGYWVSGFPEAARADIIGRLRSPDFAQHASAFWELYLHETFVRSGFEVMVHTTLAGSARRPDFIVTRGYESYYSHLSCLDGSCR